MFDETLEVLRQRATFGVGPQHDGVADPLLEAAVPGPPIPVPRIELDVGHRAELDAGVREQPLPEEVVVAVEEFPNPAVGLAEDFGRLDRDRVRTEREDVPPVQRATAATYAAQPQCRDRGTLGIDHDRVEPGDRGRVPRAHHRMLRHASGQHQPPGPTTIVPGSGISTQRSSGRSAGPASTS